MPLAALLAKYQPMEELSLGPGERKIEEIRIHWFVLLLRFIPYIILAFLPFVVIPIISLAAVSLPAFVPIEIYAAHIYASSWVRIVIGAWWLFLWISAFNIFTLYFLNVWVLTTERIIEVRQLHYFSRKVSSFFLSRIQDVTSDVEGLLGTFLDFGFIHVETAGEHEMFEMHGIRHPRGLRDMILREIDGVHRNHAGAGTEDGL